jgi:hypothetical protein
MVSQTKNGKSRDITRKIMQQGEESGFNGKMTRNLGITHEKC